MSYFCWLLRFANPCSPPFPRAWKCTHEHLSERLEERAQNERQRVSDSGAHARWRWHEAGSDPGDQSKCAKRSEDGTSASGRLSQAPVILTSGWRSTKSTGGLQQGRLTCIHAAISKVLRHRGASSKQYLRRQGGQAMVSKRVQHQIFVREPFLRWSATLEVDRAQSSISSSDELDVMTDD